MNQIETLQVEWMDTIDLDSFPKNQEVCIMAIVRDCGVLPLDIINKKIYAFSNDIPGTIDVNEIINWRYLTKSEQLLADYIFDGLD